MDTRVAATMVAVLGPPSITAISPKYDLGPSVAKGPIDKYLGAPIRDGVEPLPGFALPDDLDVGLELDGAGRSQDAHQLVLGQAAEEGDGAQRLQVFRPDPTKPRPADNDHEEEHQSGNQP